MVNIESTKIQTSCKDENVKNTLDRFACHDTRITYCKESDYKVISFSLTWLY